MTPSSKIREKARALGFSKIGFARAESLGKESHRLDEWLDRGFHASMRWMEGNRDKRTDPTLIVSGARSVISLAVNYYTGGPHETKPDTGKISRYAWGDDYHEIVGSKLKELWRWMQSEFPDEAGRYYVDTGPVMDKVWAERAGLGWIGKHTNLITQDIGSWVFLAELITTLELEYDTPETDHCGSCTLCIEACPTDAITEPYVVDSNRCISYLSIEHRGEFGKELPFEEWIYGCDICQDVCPWNEKFAEGTGEAGFQPREWNREPRLSEWQNMSDREFREKFKGSAIKRTKLSGLRRNVKTVIGQSNRRRAK